MGEMIQKWNIDDVTRPLQAFLDGGLSDKYYDAIFDICRDAAASAHRAHSYRNIKGQLESSVGVVVIRDRKYVQAWALKATSGSDPAKGLNDMNELISTKILGKSQLPDGQIIPKKGVIGIVFAAAEYASYIQDVRGRTVLHDFMPEADEVFRILKTVQI